MEVKRLNWGYGVAGHPGWINSDQKDDPSEEQSELQRRIQDPARVEENA